MLGTRIRVVHESHCPEIGPICAVRNEPPNLHDQVLYVSELRGILEYGIDDAWGVETQIPLKLTHTSIQYRRLDGTVFTPDYANIHHRNETLFGIGDPWLRVRRSFELGGFDLVLRGGVSIPLGKTVRDPFVLGEMGLSHQHIQFGTGTFDPLLAVEGSRNFGPLTARAYAQAQLVLYENGRGYRAGNRYGTGALVSMTLFGPLAASLGADIVNEQRERWNGEVHQDGNLGRTDVLASGSLSLSLSAYEISAGVKVPVYQHVIMNDEEPGQLTYPLLINLSASRSF